MTNELLTDKELNKFDGMAEEEITSSNIRKILPITETEEVTKDTSSFNIELITDKEVWYHSFRITKDGNRFRIGEINMSIIEIYKISGILTSYSNYVNYYNKLIECVIDVPNVEHLQTIHDTDILVNIDRIRYDSKVLYSHILHLGDFIKDYVLNKIQQGEIILEKIDTKYYLNLLLDHLKLKRKLLITNKLLEEKKIK